jgi:hypothetical protein
MSEKQSLRLGRYRITQEWDELKDRVTWSVTCDASPLEINPTEVRWLVSALTERIWAQQRMVQAAASMEWAGTRITHDEPEPDEDARVACCPLCGGIAPGEEYDGAASAFGHTLDCLYRKED